MDNLIATELLKHQPLERRFHVSHPGLVTFPGFLNGWLVVDIHRGDAHPTVPWYVANECVVEKRITPQHTIVVVTYRPRKDSEMSERMAASAHFGVPWRDPTTEENPVTTQEFCSPSISPWRHWLDRISNTLSILLVAGGCGALGYFTEWYMAVAPPALGVVAWAAAKLIRRRWGFYEQRFRCVNCRKFANFRCAKGQRREDGVMKCPVCGMKCRLRPGLSDMELVD